MHFFPPEMSALKLLVLQRHFRIIVTCSASFATETRGQTLFVLSQPIPGAVTEEKQG